MKCEICQRECTESYKYEVNENGKHFCYYFCHYHALDVARFVRRECDFVEWEKTRAQDNNTSDDE